MSTVTDSAPESYPIGLPDQPLTVTGTGFVDGQSKVTFNGVEQTTTFVSATSLTAPLSGSKLTAGRTVVVGVTGATGTSLLYVAHSPDSEADLIDWPCEAAPRGVYTYLQDENAGIVACVVGTVG